MCFYKKKYYNDLKKILFVPYDIYAPYLKGPFLAPEDESNYFDRLNIVFDHF